MSTRNIDSKLTQKARTQLGSKQSFLGWFFFNCARAFIGWLPMSLIWTASALICSHMMMCLGRACMRCMAASKVANSRMNCCWRLFSPDAHLWPVSIVTLLRCDNTKYSHRMMPEGILRPSHTEFSCKLCMSHWTQQSLWTKTDSKFSLSI